MPPPAKNREILCRFVISPYICVIDYVINYIYMDFFEKTGRVAIGSRLRMLTDTVTKDATRIYALYGVEIKPKWFPVFSVLSGGGATVTAIAREIGHSHPSVSNIVREMSERGLVVESADAADRRRNVVMLTAKGERTAAMLADQCADVEAAIDEISRETRNDLWRALDEWERLLSEKSLFTRVREQKRLRDGRDVRIVPYEPKYAEIFRTLNEEWITSHWEIEDADRKALEHPQEYIIDKGGHILVALFRDEPVGVCALLRTDDSRYDYELAKYAVSPTVRGRGIGVMLGRAAVDKAAELGAKRLFLESNTLLEPAIHIYRKLGFRELAEYRPAYARGDIQMELEI